MRDLALVLAAAILGGGVTGGAEPRGDATSGDAPRKLATIVVRAADHPSADTPVGIDVPEGIDPWQPLRLVEVREDARVPVPLEVDPEPVPRTDRGDRARLWWVLAGATEPGSERRFELLRAEPFVPEGVRFALDSRTLEARIGDRTVFRYNHAHVVPPRGVKPEFIRSGYIHPLFSPSGMLLTEDCPADHHHHKGIWFPWTKTRFEGRDIDFWNLGARTGTVQFAGFDEIASGPVFGRFLARHEFLDLTQKPDGKKVLDETWDVRVWAVTGSKPDRWLIDLTSIQRCATDSPLELDEYRYGGLGYRGPKEWKDESYELLTSEGKTKANGHATRAKWCANSGKIDGRWSTIVFLGHPANHEFPEPMRIWAEGGAFFNFAPVQAGPRTLEPGKTYAFRYRMLVHEGRIDRDLAERAWQDFAQPPRATIE